MNGYMEVTKEMMEAANKFWDNADDRVIRVAYQRGLDITVAECGDLYDDFLYELFDYGDYNPTDDEIAEALEEYVAE